MIKEDYVMLVIEDLVGSFLYYDRKEDSELMRGDIEELIKNNKLSVDDIVKKFKECLIEGLK